MSSSEQSNPKTAVEFFDSAAAEYEEATGGCTREMALKLLELPQLSTVFSPDAKVLDNACGTGIVTEEIVRRCAERGEETPSIAAIDAAQNMIDIARGKLKGVRYAEKITFAAMPGETLGFEDGSFSHSVTNLGILFFRDPEAGAREIYRTLREGGVAVVTSWADLGYLDAVIRPAQRAVKPGGPVYQLPIPDARFRPAHVEGCLREAGFRGVEVFETEAHYGAADLAELSRLLGTKFWGATDGWREGEKDRFREEVDRLAAGAGVAYKTMHGEERLGFR